MTYNKKIKHTTQEFIAAMSSSTCPLFHSNILTENQNFILGFLTTEVEVQQKWINLPSTQGKTIYNKTFYVWYQFKVIENIVQGGWEKND